MNLRIWIALGLCIAVGSSASAADIVYADFEGDTYGDWKTEGTAFGTGPLKSPPTIRGYRGQGLVSSFHDSDEATGTLTSPEFKLTRPFVSFLIGGGKNVEQGVSVF